MCYHFPLDTFELLDATAGYYVSRASVRPTRVETIPDPLARLSDAGVELRVLPELWSLHDAVAASTLEFSMVRMNFAAPKT